MFWADMATPSLPVASNAAFMAANPPVDRPIRAMDFNVSWAADAPNPTRPMDFNVFSAADAPNPTRPMDFNVFSAADAPNPTRPMDGRGPGGLAPSEKGERPRS